MNKEAITAAYQTVKMLWGDAVNAGDQNLIESLSKAALAMRDSALIAARPGLRQVRCVVQAGIIHIANQRDGKPLCGHDLTIQDSIDVAVRVPDCPECVEILTSEKQKI